MANAVIGALRVNLGLDSAQFHSGLKRSQTGMQRFAAKAKVAAIAAAAAFATAAVAMTKSGLSFVDSQAKAARSIDGTIDALRALQIAGGDAGVATEQIAGAMQKLGRGLADAQRKGGAAGDALESLGLKASDLLSMDADARLAAIADAVKKLGLNSAQTTSLLGDLGIRNKEMALLVMQGGDAIRAARNEVDALGLSISAVDAAKIESANDAFSRISFATEALSTRLAVAFAPALEAVAKAFSNAMREGGALRVVVDALGENIGRIAAYAATFATFMAGRFALSIGTTAVAAVLSLSLSLAGLRAAIMRTGFGVLIIAAGELVLWFGRISSAVGNTGVTFGLLKDVAVEVFQKIADGASVIKYSVQAVSSQIPILFYAALRKMAGAWVEFTWSMADGINALFGTNIQGASAVVTQELGAAQIAAMETAAAFEAAATTAASSFNTPIASLSALKAAMTTAGEGGADAIDESTDAAQSLNEELAKTPATGGAAAAGLKKVAEAASEVKETMGEVKGVSKDAFTSFVTGAKSFKDALRGVLGRLQEMAANAAFERLWGGITGGFTKKSSGGGLLGNIVKSLIGANANGTPNWRGGLTSINERGGEIIDLPSGSRVIPHEMSNKMMGGMGAEVRVVGGDLTLTDDGKIAARMQVVGQQSRAGAVRDVRQSFGSMTNQYNRDGVLG